jgi:hypothetical protein
MSRITIACVLFLLGSLSCDYWPSKASEEDLLRFLDRRGPIGSSADVVLMKRSPLRGEWDDIAVLYGMADDADLCSKVSNLLMREYPGEEWSCRAANK